jgi:hypothetical protein
MENYITLFVVTLEKLGHLTQAESKALVKELQSSTLPQGYDAMSVMVTNVLDKAKIKRKKVDTKK